VDKCKPPTVDTIHRRRPARARVAHPTQQTQIEHCRHGIDGGVGGGDVLGVGQAFN